MVLRMKKAEKRDNNEAAEAQKTKTSGKKKKEKKEKGKKVQGKKRERCFIQKSECEQKRMRPREEKYRVYRCTKPEERKQRRRSGGKYINSMQVTVI